MSESESKLTLKFKQEFYDAVPHLMRGKVTRLEAKDPNVGIDLDAGNRTWPTEDDEVVAEGVTQSLHCFYKDGKTRYFIATSDDDFQAFKDKLFRECQLQNVLCDENGYVLDGFARWVALEMLNIEVKYTIVGNLPDDASKITFIRSQKLCRHNLTEEDRMKIVKDEIVAHPKRAIAWTASLLGVSRTTVHKYRKELEGLGLVPVLTELETRDGRLVEHESYSKEKKAQDDADAKRYKERTKRKEAHRKERKQLEAMQEGVREYKKANADKLLDIGRVGDSLKNITDFLKHEKVGKVAFASVKAELEAIRQALPAPETATLTATASWKVKAVEIKKTKQGVTLKLDADAMPDSVDLAEVPPGQVSINGRVVKFEAGKALLLMAPKPKDAVIERPSDADSDDGFDEEKGTVDPSSAVG